MLFPSVAARVNFWFDRNWRKLFATCHLLLSSSSNKFFVPGVERFSDFKKIARIKRRCFRDHGTKCFKIQVVTYDHLSVAWLCEPLRGFLLLTFSCCAWCGKFDSRTTSREWHQLRDYCCFGDCCFPSFLSLLLRFVLVYKTREWSCLTRRHEHVGTKDSGELRKLFMLQRASASFSNDPLIGTWARIKEITRWRAIQIESKSLTSPAKLLIKRLQGWSSSWPINPRTNDCVMWSKLHFKRNRNLRHHFIDFTHKIIFAKTNEKSHFL